MLVVRSALLFFDHLIGLLKIWKAVMVLFDHFHGFPKFTDPELAKTN
jgi:hypothetical protein